MMSGNVKSEPNEEKMVSIPINQYEQLVESNEYPSHQKIELLNNMIRGTNDQQELIEYYQQRSVLYYEENKHQDVLSDLAVLERYGALKDKFLMMKWISTVHCRLGEVRADIAQSINVGFVGNIDDAISLYNCMGEAKIKKFIQNNHKYGVLNKKNQLN